MHITGAYSHKGGLEFIKRNRPAELADLYVAVERLDAADCLRKISAEKAKPPLIFSPTELNDRLKRFLSPRGWSEPAPGTAQGFKEPRLSLGGREYREMDGLKNKVGLEIQFGKYAFMGYDIFLKMPIFARRGLIDCGIELVVMPSMLPHMSTGVSSYDQIKIDMEQRGVADLDVPTLVLGFECTEQEWKDVEEKRERFRTDPKGMLERGEVRGSRGAKPGPK